MKALGLSLFVLCFCFAIDAKEREIPFFEKNELTPYWPNETKGMVPAKIGAFKAIKQNESELNQKEFKGQLSLVNFFFVQCPDVCPLMMKNVQRLQKALEGQTNKIKIYSFSVLPQVDTPERLRSYAETYKINLSNWTLLTGDKKEIYRVGKSMFKADGAVGEQKSEDSFIHTQNIYLVDQDLNIRGIYDTNNFKDMAQLKEDIGILNKAVPRKLAHKAK